MVKICIDPGHGGTDSGSIGVGSIYEKNINLAVAKLLNEELKVQGFDTMMIRTSDATKSLPERTSAANKFGANSFISLHCNWSESSSPHGTQTYIYKFNGEAEKLANKIQARLQPMNGVSKWERVEDDNFYVLRNTVMPAILIELGFISNAADYKWMTDPNIQKEIAKNICKGFCEYYGVEYKVPQSFWSKDDKGWRYTNSDGTVATNAWVEDSVGWCYVGADGYCVTDKWVPDNVGWCYLNSEGRAVKNVWRQINGKWYYFDNYYHAVKGMQKIDNHYYYFAEHRYESIEECQLIITNDDGEIQI